MRFVKSIFLYRNLFSQARDDERHSHALFIERKFLEHLVATACLPVVRTEDDERIVVQRCLSQQREDSSDLCINFFDESVIVPSQITPMAFIPTTDPFKNSRVDKRVVNPSADPM